MRCITRNPKRDCFVVQEPRLAAVTFSQDARTQTHAGEEDAAVRPNSERPRGSEQAAQRPSGNGGPTSAALDLLIAMLWEV